MAGAVTSTLPKEPKPRWPRQESGIHNSWVEPPTSPENKVNGMAARGLPRLGMLALIAPSGVMIGHAVAYLIAVPDPAERAVVLAASGHGWWTLGTVAGPALAATGALLFLVAVLRRPPDGGTFRRELSRWLGPRLAACQLSLFVVIETAERVVVGHPLWGNLYHEIIEHGALAQVIVAFAITGLFWCLALALDLACVAITQGPVPAAIGIPPSAGGRVHPPRVRRRLLNARAPPRLAG